MMRKRIDRETPIQRSGSEIVEVANPNPEDRSGEHFIPNLEAPFLSHRTLMWRDTAGQREERRAEVGLGRWVGGALSRIGRAHV